MKILVTGGAGFIGSHTIVELIEHGYNPIIVDDLRNSEGFIVNHIEKICGRKIPHHNIDFGNIGKPGNFENPGNLGNPGKDDDDDGGGDGGGDILPEISGIRL